MVKEPYPASKKEGNEMQDEFVEQPFAQSLLHPG